MNRMLLVPLLLALVAAEPVSSTEPSGETVRLRQQVQQLRAALAEKDEQIRVLQAELQAHREQIARLQQAYRKAILPEEQEHREMVRREQEARRRAEERVDQARRQAGRQRHDRIKRSLEPMRYLQNPWGTYYRSAPYRTSPYYPYGYRLYRSW